MAKWQRFGDDTWVNVDQVEVLRIEEDEDGRWQLTAAFSSGRAYPVGAHDDRQLLADCTDALIRGEVSDRLRVWAEESSDQTAEEPVPAAESVDEPAEPVKSRWWHIGRFSPKATPAR